MPSVFRISGDASDIASGSWQRLQSWLMLSPEAFANANLITGTALVVVAQAKALRSHPLVRFGSSWTERTKAGA